MREQTHTMLNDQAEIPIVGFGTYLIENEQAGDIVGEALAAGYRHIDTAEGYRNESGVGEALQRFWKAGGAREDVFVTTKLWPGNAAWGQATKGYDETLASFEASRERLGLGHVDLYLIHAPFGGAHRLDEWRALVHLREQGKAKAIGVSNFSEQHLEEIRAAGLPMPDANQIELHPWSQKPALVAYLREHGVTPIAYSSLIPLSTWRAKPGEDSGKTDEMRADGERADSPFKVMAQKHGVSEAQILLRWGVQMGYPVLPKSTSPERMRKNLDVFGFELDADEMAAVEGMDRGDGVAWSAGDPIKGG